MPQLELIVILVTAFGGFVMLARFLCGRLFEVALNFKSNEDAVARPCFNLSSSSTGTVSCYGSTALKAVLRSVMGPAVKDNDQPVLD